ncbi:hypothetical protein M8445_16965 (plasmid) [Deinococcus aquaticus]|uniref:Phage portal protein n=2 Tax=Deinococcus aquaticus TaxID=328692 RepID=A0ABY7V639_9DEIO|nr:hypothetical protein [Deinococcus aquaticus]WDA60658.1 hypothetical protein M8445_16965 [Deinococcus aquaticus]
MTTLYGPDGQPLRHSQETRAVQIRGGQPLALDHLDLNPGWRDYSSADGNLFGRYGFTRAFARQTCRTVYAINGLFQVAVDLAAAFLVGDAIRYGTLADKGLQQIMEDFWMANGLEHVISSRMINEWMLDGEQAIVFPTGADAPGADAPAIIGMLDVDHAGFRLDANTSRGATPSDMAERLQLELTQGNPLTWERGEFVWNAHNAFWNDPRGYPISLGAADFAIAYVNMMNMRLNVHQLQQRILAVYKAFLDPNGKDADGVPDGGVHGWRMKGMGFRVLPEQGGVIQLVHQPGYTDRDGVKYDGVNESLDFMRPAQGAADAAQDMKLIMRMVGLAIGGMPEHYFGEGGGATRTTAESMGLPSIRLANKRQAAFRHTITRMLRAEAVRRGGRDRKWQVAKGSRRRVPIDLIEFPIEFPEIREESLETIIRRAEFAAANGYASAQTLTSDIGFDAAREKDRGATALQDNPLPRPAPQE